MQLPIRTLKRARLVVPVALALWLGLWSSSEAVLGTTLLRISQDPYPTTVVGQHHTEVEPDTYSHGSTIVSAFQVGRIVNGGGTDIGFATSSDGGATWTDGLLPGTTVNAPRPGTYAAASDASVAFDPKDGIWLISYLGLRSLGGSKVDVLVSRSTDGVNWSSPVTVNVDGDFNDKNWTTCDTTLTSPFYGRCYTEFDDNTLGDLELMSTSANGGESWGTQQTTGNKDHGIGGQPLVQPNGTVIVPFNSFRGAAGFNVQAFESTNGGASWSASSTVAPVFFRRAAGGIRDSIPLPSAEMDASGKVYVTWQDSRFEPMRSASDLVLSTSTDGVNWTDPVRIPADPIGSGVDHFIPGLAVDRSTSGSSAHLLVAYYFYPNANCTAATCQLEVGYTSSKNGGATWAAGTTLAGPMSLSWLANTTQGVMVGDYISTSFNQAGVAFPAFAVANAPSGSVFDEATYTVAGGLQATGGNLPAGGTSNLSAPGQQTTSTITSQ